MKEQSKKILIVEDNLSIADLLSQALKEVGYQVEIRTNLAQAYTFFTTNPEVSLIVLDLILPDGDGLSLLKYIRGTYKYQNIPVLIISAKGQELDRVLGFELGADDYVVKPFSLKEVVLRIKRLLKKPDVSVAKYLSVGPLVLDKEKKAIYLENRLLSLTSTEFKILSVFIENPYKIFSREELSNIIWTNEKEYYSRVLDAYICRIRSKLGKHGEKLQTIRGLGYRLVPD